MGQAEEVEVHVAAVCLDADVALLSCSSSGFWDDMQAVDLEMQLPGLQVCKGVVCMLSTMCCVRCNITERHLSKCCLCGGSCIRGWTDDSLNLINDKFSGSC